MGRVANHQKKKKEKKLAIIQNLETYRGLVSNKEGGEEEFMQ